MEKRAALAKHPSLLGCLVHPCVQTRAFNESSPALHNLPYPLWIVLVLLAIGGSLLYGASLSLVIPQWHPLSGALWLALSAGIAWCIFGPLLVILSHSSPFTCAHSCLTTMAYGELILVAAAAFNLIGAIGQFHALSYVLSNILFVALSDAIMAIMLTLQMQALGMPLWKTLAAWIFVLNGSFLVLAWLLYGLLFK
jgi:hypothetical protein